MRTFVVRIDLERLRTNLSKQEGRELTAGDVFTWLEEARVSALDEQWWMVEEPDLGQLEPEEVLEARVLGEPEEQAGPGDPDSPTAVPEA